MHTRVVIADDHLFVSRGLVSALSSVAGLTVLQTVSNGIEAISAIRKHRPDVAIQDYNMPGANGLEVCLEAQRWAPATRFLLLTGSMQAQMVDAGVHGVMLKDGSKAEIINAVRQVREGKPVISASARRMLDSARLLCDRRPDRGSGGKSRRMWHQPARQRARRAIAFGFGVWAQNSPEWLAVPKFGGGRVVVVAGMANLARQRQERRYGVAAPGQPGFGGCRRSPLPRQSGNLRLLHGSVADGCA